MRTNATKLVTPPQAAGNDSAALEGLRAAVDARLDATGKGKRAEALRLVNLSNTTFERLLREGLSADGRPSVVRKIRRMGVFDLIPRK